MRKHLLLLTTVLAALMLASCGNDEPVVRLNYEAVDLGLSVKWATMNIGAAKTTAYGKLMGWADSSGVHSTQDGIVISYRDNKTYCEWNSPYYGGKSPMNNISGSDYDAARYMWNLKWRVPTQAEWQELINGCTWTTETTAEGLRVARATGPNGKSVIFQLGGIDEVGDGSPADRGVIGYYWTATFLPQASQTSYGYESNVACAAWAVVMSDGRPQLVPQVRCYHLLIRPVLAE